MGPYADRRFHEALAALDWPLRAASQRVSAGGATWHVQTLSPMSDDEHAPTLLLAHGAAASLHSFAKLAPLLAARLNTIAVDLPGHGFSQGFTDRDLTLGGMASALARLLDRLGASPDFVLGHSAGAALLLQMAAEGLIGPKRIFALNGAFEPMRAAGLAAPLARLLFANPIVPSMFAWRSRRGDVAGRLLSMTGSPLTEADLRPYRALFARSDHVRGALGMMAGWDLRPLVRRMDWIRAPTTLIVARDDAMVHPEVSIAAAARMPFAELIESATGGHLLHEAMPEYVADLVSSRIESRDSVPAERLAQ